MFPGSPSKDAIKVKGDMEDQTWTANIDGLD